MGKTTKKTHLEFIGMLESKYGEGTFEVIGRYVNNKTKLSFCHLECGSVFKSSPKDMLRKKYGCPLCARNKQTNRPRLSNDEFLERFKKDREGYTALSEYKTSREKIKVRHDKCGAIFYATANNLLTKNSGCPQCKQSKGELAVSNYLRKIGIEFTQEVSYKDCRFKQPLRFDFVLGNVESPCLVIEFDGEQHFEEKEFFGGEEGFKLTKIRDQLKDEYCKSKGIPILRIPYFRLDDVEELIKNALPRQEAS